MFLLWFSSVVCWNGKIHNMASSLFFLFFCYIIRRSCTKFSALLPISYNFLLDLYQRPSLRKGNDYMHSVYLYCCYLFWLIFFDHIDSSLLERWAVQQNAFFYSYNWHYQVSCYCVYMSFFFIVPRAPTFTGIVVVLRCHTFSISISRYLPDIWRQWHIN